MSTRTKIQDVQSYSDMTGQPAGPEPCLEDNREMKRKAELFRSSLPVNPGSAGGDHKRHSLRGYQWPAAARAL